MGEQGIKKIMSDHTPNVIGKLFSESVDNILLNNKKRVRY